MPFEKEYQMNEKHLNYLIHLGDNTKDYIGNNSLNWGVSVLGENTDLDPYLNKRFDRYELFEYCKNPNINNLNALVAILSWGGMRHHHGKQLFNSNSKEIVLRIVGDLRNNTFKTRKRAFEVFQKERNEGNLSGIGIGYFTKLICFLSPDLNGYIMDQWVGKSINLLSGMNIVKLTSNKWVNDQNNSDTYEMFCSHIDHLAERLGCSGFEAEKRIFSLGRGKGKWRTYLINNYNPKKLKQFR